MAKKQGQNYMHGAAILTVGVLIMKVLGMIYKIPLGNLLGDDGYSLFIGAYNIYNIFFTLATAGLPVAVSRLIAEADARGAVAQEEKTFRVALKTFAVLGLVFSSLMFFFPEWLASSYLENPDAALSIKAMSPAILLVCLVSAYRGYCQGNGNMIPTTVDEVLEVLFKAIFGLVIAAVLLGMGFDKTVGSAGAILGVSIGSVVSLGYMVVYKKLNYASLSGPYTAGKHATVRREEREQVDSDLTIVKNILRIGVPIAFGACVLSLLNSIDSKLCMNRLQEAAGFSYQEAKVLYGVYGKAQTIFNLPAAIITPLTIAIVPAISAACARKDRGSAAKVSEDSMRIAAVLAMPMGVGLAVMSQPIMALLYPSSHASGGTLLMIMGISSIFVCMLLMLNAVLQAYGCERFTMITLIIGGIIKVGVNFFLVAQPGIHIYGAPVGTLVSYVVMCTMDYVYMVRRLDRAPNPVRVLAKPLIGSALMGVSAWGVYGLCRGIVGAPGWGAAALSTMLAILAAAAVYLVCVICTGMVTLEDLSLIPGGKKLGRLLHIR